MDEISKMVLAAGGMCALATSREDQPWVSLMAYVFEPERKSLLMMTPASSRKTKNLRTNPKVGLLVDTRRDEAAAQEGIMALSADGVAEFLEGEEAGNVRQRILELHPDLSELAEQDLLFIRVTVVSHQLLRGPTQVVSRSRGGG
jgi:nitroimidazol reductase NimA-like FMN-containing flavoprotein (pyridoxamine 5'-phosphate oxidase superfamily)